MNQPRIAFIGAGNMAKSIIGGLLAQGTPAQAVTASGPRLENLQPLQAATGVNISTSNIDAASQADIVILAVKPQMLKMVAAELSAALTHRPLIISLAAGITTDSINRWLGGDQAIVRCMPNTPSQLRQGASGLFANAQVSAEQRASADAILRAVGVVEWLDDEALLNPVTAVSGSGPAYFFLFMEAMIDAGEAMGLSRESARELTLQTALGAAMLARDSDVDVSELRRRVTSPKGTTEQAILSFEQDKLRDTVARAMNACSARAAELSEQLGQ